MNYQNTTGHAATRYTEQDIRNSDPMALVVRVYEIAAQNVKKARAALDSRDWAAKGKAVHKASRSLALLQATLDRDKGGEVAQNLDRLYTYFQMGLSEAHVNNDGGKFGEIADHLNELLSTWREAADKHRTETSQTSESPRHARAGATAEGGR